ncbi:hypothetical protein [Flavobacterium sp. WC2509]|uniref:hypothetical protein n=1 Tax=Flavobacterium sp. WC2509 TaxID=3461406 RepID=UPI0040446CBA
MVERANNALNLATNVEPSKRCVTYMPILDVNYLGESFNKSNSTNMESSGTNNTICKEFQF